MISIKNYPNYQEKEYCVDGANVCWHITNKYRKPKLSNLKLLFQEFFKLKIHENQYKIICDATLLHDIDSQYEYRVLIKKGIVFQAPVGIKADKFLLNYCLNHSDALIVSNDLFRDYLIYFPRKSWLEERRIGFIIYERENELTLMPNKSN